MPEIPVHDPEDRDFGTDYPRLKGRCPACGNDTLFRGSKGFITCSWLKCSEPAAAHDLLMKVSNGESPRPVKLRTGTPERQRIIARAIVQRAEIEQIFLDIASWNDNSVDRKNGAPPIDPDPDGMLRRMADGLDRMIAAEIVAA